MNAITLGTRLDDAQLLAQLRHCVSEERGASARLLVHLGEVDARGLYRDEGFSSMFEYLVRSLHMSESEAALRIRVARLGRQFPAALEMLARGELHLTALRLLAPVLTHENEHLLSDARFMSKEQVLMLLAKQSPRPDVPNLIRQLPSRRVERKPTSNALVLSTETAGRGEAEFQRGDPASSRPTADTPAATLRDCDAASTSHAIPARQIEAACCAPPALSAPQPSATHAATPLRVGRFKVQFTANQQLRDKLQTAEHLLRHQVPNGDIAVIIERALDLLIAQRKKQLFGETTRPRSRRSSSSGDHTGRASPATPAHTHPNPNNSVDETGAASLPRAALHSKLAQKQIEPRQNTPMSRADRSSAGIPRVARADRDSPDTPRVARAERNSPDIPRIAGPEKNSRYIPRSLRRAVIARDGTQCSFHSADGRRCQERSGLEFHHEQPFALGGVASFENIRLLCRSHNALMAERDFGRELIVHRRTSTRVPEPIHPS